MDESQLRNFLMIGRCSSITEAADRLGIAQPSLSQQLLRLEDELNAKLFRRTSRGVALSEAGRIFLEHASNILKSMNRAREEVQFTESVPTGKVTFGMPSSTSQLLGVPLLIAVRAEIPNVALRIRESLNINIRRWLEDGRTDLAILYNAEGAHHLTVKHIADETLYLIGPQGEFGESDERGIALKPVSLETLSSCKLILPTAGHGLRRLIEQRATKELVSLSIAIEIDSLPHIKTLIAAGMGYSLLSHAGVSAELKSGQLSAAPIGDIDLSRSVSLVRNPSQPIDRASIEVEDIAFRLLREMIKDHRWVAELPKDSKERALYAPRRSRLQ